MCVERMANSTYGPEHSSHSPSPGDITLGFKGINTQMLQLWHDVMHVFGGEAALTTCRLTFAPVFCTPNIVNQ